MGASERLLHRVRSATHKRPGYATASERTPTAALVVVVVELPMAELVCALQSLLHTDVLPVADDMDPIALDECVTFDLCAERLRLVFNVTSVRPPPPPPRP